MAFILICFRVFFPDHFNLALNKQAYASSSRFANPNNAGLAVDGNYKPEYYDSDEGSCTHTSDTPQQAEWWAVDLAEHYYVTRVILTNRLGSSKEIIT